MKNETEVLTDIIQHISEVRENIEAFAGALRNRGISHDRSKLNACEFDAFVSTNEDFKKADYGSPEYQKCVEAIKPAVDHHYANNRHHTGYHQNGINDMTLVDIVEMVCDWKAAARRSPNKSFADTLTYAFKKYGINDQLQQILINTFQALGWIK
ncbi:MAG: DUF5662 family protein [Desulfosalsimonas sp.]